MTDNMARRTLDGTDDSSSRPTHQLLTVADVRSAINAVARGEFGAGGLGQPRPASHPPLSVEDPRYGDDPRHGDDRRSPVAGHHSTAPDCTFTSVGLLEQWSTSTMEVDCLRALETAQLAAFALSRVLNRDGGEEELEEFLTARDALADSATARPENGAARPENGAPRTDNGAALATSGQYVDTRISSRARGLIASEDAIVVAVKLKKTKLETARRITAAAIVAFLGLHNLLTSVAQGRVPLERVTRLGFRIDDALLPLSEVQTLDRHLDQLSPGISMDQYEKQARMHIRILDPLPKDPDAARKNRCVRVERCDDDTAILTMVGPIDVIEALFQRLRAMARAIRRQELGALGLSSDGLPVDVDELLGRLLDDRRIAELMFDLLAAARPQTQVRVGPRNTDNSPSPDSSHPGDDSHARNGSHARDDASNESLPDGSIVDVLCPTDGSWLRKQAAVTVTVPLTTIMGLDEHPGRINGDVPFSAQRCREAASHSTSWYRVLTDPATSIVTDHIAQTYEPTAAMRRTIRQKWRTCTVPGCSKPAEWCEIDHCCSFSKRDPRTGGLTVMENLHPACVHHHKLKTMGILRLKRLSKDEVAWVLPMGVTATTSPPPLVTGMDAISSHVALRRAQSLSDLPVSDEYEGPDLFSTVVEPVSDGTEEAPPF